MISPKNLSILRIIFFNIQPFLTKSWHFLKGNQYHIYKGFRVIWPKSHVDTFGSFHVIDKQTKILHYICVDNFMYCIYTRSLFVPLSFFFPFSICSLLLILLCLLYNTDRITLMYRKKFDKRYVRNVRKIS